MTTTAEHLQALCSLEGVSGREEAVREYILSALESSPASKEVVCDSLGNIVVRMEGRRRAAKTLMFAAHMDEVGLIVTGITTEGYLRFAAVGGIDPQVLYGRRVRIRGHLGIIGGKAVHLCSGDDKKIVPPIADMLIDLGIDSREEAEKLAHPGDVAVWDSPYRELENGLVKGRAIDDRAGCALLLKLAEQMPEYDLVLAFTVQEEIGLRGAKTAAFSIQPDIAVVVDATTAADTAGVPEGKQVCCVGKGAVVSFMDKRTLYDPALYDQIWCIAQQDQILLQPKTMVAGGNDAGSIQLAGRGARVAAVSLPCRYIHSPSCVLSLSDLDQTLRLLRRLAEELPI